MKRNYPDPLLKEILADDSLEAVRRRSLEQGVAIAWRRRQRAHWAKGGLISVLLLVSVWLLLPNRQNPSMRYHVAQGPGSTSTGPAANVAPVPRGTATVRFISDDELLALFPGRPLALIGPPGRKTLVFLDRQGVSSPP